MRIAVRIEAGEEQDDGATTSTRAEGRGVRTAVTIGVRIEAGSNKHDDGTTPASRRRRRRDDASAQGQVRLRCILGAS